MKRNGRWSAKLYAGSRSSLAVPGAFPRRRWRGWRLECRWVKKAGQATHRHCPSSPAPLANSDGNFFGEQSDEEHPSTHQQPEQLCIAQESKGDKGRLPASPSWPGSVPASSLSLSYSSGKYQGWRNPAGDNAQARVLAPGPAVHRGGGGGRALWPPGSRAMLCHHTCELATWFESTARAVWLCMCGGRVVIEIQSSDFVILKFRWSSDNCCFCSIELFSQYFLICLFCQWRENGWWELRCLVTFNFYVSLYIFNSFGISCNCLIT